MGPGPVEAEARQGCCGKTQRRWLVSPVCPGCTIWEQRGESAGFWGQKKKYVRSKARKLIRPENTQTYRPQTEARDAATRLTQ